MKNMDNKIVDIIVNYLNDMKKEHDIYYDKDFVRSVKAAQRCAAVYEILKRIEQEIDIHA